MQDPDAHIFERIKSAKGDMSKVAIRLESPMPKPEEVRRLKPEVHDVPGLDSPQVPCEPSHRAQGSRFETCPEGRPRNENRGFYCSIFANN